jgi:hypothetical protein
VVPFADLLIGATALSLGYSMLTVKLAREPCNVRGRRIDRDGGKKLLDEGFTARPAFSSISTVDLWTSSTTPTGDNAASWSPAVSITRWRKA